MKNHVQAGHTLTFAAPYRLASGDGCKIGALFGVASYPIHTGGEAELVTVGVFTLPRKGDEISAGDAVYWDDLERAATSTATGNLKIGVATVAAAANSPTVDVRLNGSF